MKARACLAMVALLGGIGVLSVLSVPSASAAPQYPAVLAAGRSLVAGSATNRLDSPSGEFEFEVGPAVVNLTQYAPLVQLGSSTAIGTWFADNGNAYNASQRDRSVLTMQTDGNLVLRLSDRRVVWASGTAGSGTANRLAVQDDGNLVIRTSANRAVWSSGTGFEILPAGRTLKSGQSLINHDPGGGNRSITTAAMQTDGNLVVRLNGAATWSTRTFVRGSYATMQNDGNLVVRTPQGRAVWATGTRQGNDTWLTVSTCGGFALNNARLSIWEYWSTPYVSRPGLGC